MKKNYLRSEIEIICLDASDVVATSSGIALAGAFDERSEDCGSFANLFH